jgi:hypothetical protein
MLREKYDLHVRVAVDPDEVRNDESVVDAHAAKEAPAAPHGPSSPAASANTSEEEEELENVIGPDIPTSTKTYI